MERLAKSGWGTATYARPQCTGEIKSLNTQDLQKDIANLISGESHGVERGFMNAALARRRQSCLLLPNLNQYYASRVGLENSRCAKRGIRRDCQWPDVQLTAR